MPNWCQNVAYIGHDEQDLIDDLVDKINNDKEKFFEYIRPRPGAEDENWYSWNLENWGTKWEVSPYEYSINEDGKLYVSFDSAWGPPTNLYDYMYDKGYDVEAFYNEEGMAFAGWYIDGEDNQYQYGDLSADEVEDQLPSKLDEMFNISQYKRDNEEYDEEEDSLSFDDEEEDEEDSEPNWELEYGFTDWFTKKDKPVYNGLYQVKTKEWPWPMKANWNGKSWDTPEKVTEWRGLAEDPVAKEIALAKALDELKEEFEKLMAEEEKE
jgi:hypothetical protein